MFPYMERELIEALGDLFRVLFAFERQISRHEPPSPVTGRMEVLAKHQCEAELPREAELPLFADETIDLS
jgi:hypothetical protein